ncbi:hypothetical protein GSY69_10990 [Brevibacterium sp. 5221]|uniref:Uncharacterized protein n=1 Tax=Brevibacterium rongguiense TaxID=2695267 RepID=A0A6N9H929_9MICO|nr:hypothetical protein [Brevibacterium rongguiense]MYM20475.1 hypothetical protein [Brevibacterium rongguiense]
MKVAVGILLSLVLLVPLCLVVLLGDDASGNGGDGCESTEEIKVGGPNVKVTGVKAIKGYSKKQMSYAAIINKVVDDERMGQPAKIMSIMAAIKESTLGTGAGWDKPNGDHDAGLFQQRVPRRHCAVGARRRGPASSARCAASCAGASRPAAFRPCPVHG